MLPKSLNKLITKESIAISLTLFVIALGFRLPLLNGSFWLDEAAQALESSRPFSEQLNIAYDFQPPLLHYITHFALYFSRSEWWLRLIGAVLPGVISICATYWIGKKLIDQKTGFLAAILMATNSFHIFYSQELRPYALPLMLGSLSWLVLLYWEAPKKKLQFFKKHPLFSWYSAYTVLTLLGLYSSYLYPFLIISQALYILVRKRELLITYIYHAIFWVAGFLPWLPFFYEQLTVGGELRSTLPNWETVVSIESSKSLALVIGKFMFGVLDLQFSLLFIAGAFVLMLPIAWAASIIFLPHGALQRLTDRLMTIAGKKSKKDTDQLRNALWLLLFWFVIPLVTSWLISFIVPVLRPKRVLFLMPAFYLLIVASLQSFPHQKIKQIFLGILLLLNVYSTYQYFTSPRLQREDWRTLHQNVTYLYPADSVAVFSFPEPFAPWMWYNQESYPSLATGTLAIKDADLELLQESVSTYTYVLTFDYLRDLTDPNNKLGTMLQNAGYQEMDYIDQTNIGFVRVYAQPQENPVESEIE